MDTLPEPVVSYERLKLLGDSSYDSLRSIFWNRGPINATILQAVFNRLEYTYHLGVDLCQVGVCSSSPTNGREKLLLKCFQDWAHGPLSSLDTLDRLHRYREIWSSPISHIQEEGTSSSMLCVAYKGMWAGRPSIVHSRGSPPRVDRCDNAG